MISRGVVALLALVAMGCVGSPDAPTEPTVPPDPAVSPNATLSPDPTVERPPDVAVLLTEDDSGASVALVQGERLAVRLGHDWVWSSPEVDGTAVAVAPVQYESDPGFTEWSVEATEPGSVRISIAGEPNCPDSAMCPTRTFAVDVIVIR